MHFEWCLWKSKVLMLAPLLSWKETESLTSPQRRMRRKQMKALSKQALRLKQVESTFELYFRVLTISAKTFFFTADSADVPRIFVDSTCLAFSFHRKLSKSGLMEMSCLSCRVKASRIPSGCCCYTSKKANSLVIRQFEVFSECQRWLGVR